jgi:hypothetical protein
MAVLESMQQVCSGGVNCFHAAVGCTLASDVYSSAQQHCCPAARLTPVAELIHPLIPRLPVYCVRAVHPGECGYTVLLHRWRTQLQHWLRHTAEHARSGKLQRAPAPAE